MNVLLESNFILVKKCIVGFSFNVSLSNSICFESTINNLFASFDSLHLCNIYIYKIEKC